MKLPRAVASATAIANLTTLHIPSLSESSINSTNSSTQGQANVDVDSYIYCDPFYGRHVKSLEVLDALDELPRGKATVDYTTDIFKPNHIPIHITAGDAQISVEIGGPTAPSFVHIAPDTIRDMVKTVAHKCVAQSGPDGGIGGFITAGMAGLALFLADPIKNLQREWPSSTSFLTVTITNKLLDICPPDWDPKTAEWCTFITTAAAHDYIAGSPVWQVLTHRALRFQELERQMRRGSELAFWAEPQVGIRLGAKPVLNETVTVLDPNAVYKVKE